LKQTSSTVAKNRLHLPLLTLLSTSEQEKSNRFYLRTLHELLLNVLQQIAKARPFSLWV